MEPQTIIDSIVKTEPKIQLKNPPIMEGNLGMIMRKLERARKQQVRDANLRENNLYCRKRCKLFKKCECFKKTFEEQKRCEESKGYLTLEAELQKNATAQA